MRHTFLLAVSVVSLAALTIAAQSGKPSASNPAASVAAAQSASAAAANPAQAAPAPPAGTAPEDMEATDQTILEEGESLYRHGKDRDPFSPLITLTKTKGGEVKRKFKKEGIGQFTVDSCVLEGIVKSAEGTFAWFSSPNNKPYKVSVGEEFADGKVTAISFEKGHVVIQQELLNESEVKPFRDLILSVRTQGGEGK